MYIHSINIKTLQKGQEIMIYHDLKPIVLRILRELHK